MNLLKYKISFIKEVSKLNEAPEKKYPEIAIIGRSNAGKSTAINAIFNKKKLAFSSKIPGKTKKINYFLIRKLAKQIGYFVDLPGYGYSKINKIYKINLDNFILEFLTKRIQLCGIIIAMDCRNPFTNLDIKMINIMNKKEKPIHILLTKFDKLSFLDKKICIIFIKKIIDICNQFNYINKLTIQEFSSIKKIGLEQIRSLIIKWILTN